MFQCQGNHVHNVVSVVIQHKIGGVKYLLEYSAVKEIRVIFMYTCPQRLLVGVAHNWQAAESVPFFVFLLFFLHAQRQSGLVFHSRPLGFRECKEAVTSGW